MNASHAAFFDRAEGPLFRQVIERPELLAQYELLSRIELPAVQAVVWDLEPLIETLDARSRIYATQSSGALIGELLSSRGYRVLRDSNGEKKRGRVRQSKFIKTGTIFEKVPDPASSRDEKVRLILDDLFVRYRETLEALAK